MSSQQINGGTVFPEGTSVGAYLRTQWGVEALTGAPSGSAVSTATVTSGVATFTGLNDDREYIAYAQVSGVDRYKRFITHTNAQPSFVATPAQQNVLAWSWDPALITNTSAPGQGIIRGARILIPTSMTVSQIGVIVKTGGTGATPLANCFMALYSKTGTRLGVTADQSTGFNAASSLRSVALTPDATGSLNLTGGTDEYVFGALLIGTQSTTPAAFGARSQASSSGSNSGQIDGSGNFIAGTKPRAFSSVATGLSAMPSTLDVSSSGIAPGVDYCFLLS